MISAKSPQLTKKSLLKTQALINGKWKSLNGSFAVTDPATGAEICSVPDGTAQDTRDAIDAAYVAQQQFKLKTGRERSDLLRNWARLIKSNEQDLSTILSWENGKPLAEAKGEILSCVQTFEWFADQAANLGGDTISSQNPNARIHTLRQPVGVCGIITPWNFPASMIARKIGAAVAAGCAGVIKPASETPLSALAMGDLAQQAGIPDGIVNVVTTHGHTKDVGKELCTNPKVKKITFTGSTPIGKVLMGQASSTMKKTSFELGGNSPFIVFEDANLEKAVSGAMASKFRGSGQTCICANRIFVHESIYDDFIAAFLPKVKALKLGHAFDSDTTQGPLIKQASIDKVTDHVEDALAKGGKLLTGGKVAAEGPNFFEPTVIVDCDPNTMKVFQDETFGPLAAIAKFKTDEEVIAYSNSVPVGLAGYFYTESLRRAHKVSEALEFGMLGVNTGAITEVALPFGGVKESGFGREMSKYGLDDYTVLKSVSTWLN